MKKVLLTILLIAVSISLIACGEEESSNQEVNLGYFPNISHAPAMIGIEKGIFEESFGEATVNTKNFPNGSLFMDALSTGQIDMGYVGPGPALNRFLQGGEVVMIGNASKGENVLVVRNDIEFNDVKDLDGKIVATPSTGCTHDLIFRKMLEENGMSVEENGGKVKRIAQKPATMIGLFQQKQIDAAMVSEPWASQMESKGVARVVRDVKEVPWKGDIPAAVLVARKDFVESNPEIIEKFIASNEQAVEYINNNKEEIEGIVSKQIKSITNQEIEKEIINSSLNRVEYSTEVNKEILQEFANLSKSLGFIEGDSDLGKFFGNNL
ncbi:MAG: ABC transporter substrate-binding protein [Tissierella sp.]|uniref:ABC transporter substrate-binding protein n=1 Tax=Tissierella sp. TaxID=41274 RepID=UPI003F96DB71